MTKNSNKTAAESRLLESELLGDDPVLTLNIHPPVEVKEEVEAQIKELAKLEEEEIKS